jgi:hypothetical protein
MSNKVAPSDLPKSSSWSLFGSNKVTDIAPKYISANAVSPDEIKLTNVSDTQFEDINKEIKTLKDQITEIKTVIIILKKQIEDIPNPPPAGGGKLRKSKRKTIRYKNRKSKKH